MFNRKKYYRDRVIGEKTYELKKEISAWEKEIGELEREIRPLAREVRTLQSLIEENKEYLSALVEPTPGGTE